MNKERANKSRQENLKPFVIENQNQINSFNGFPFPNFGDFRPKGWKLVETYFVDSSGMGANNEPALSIRQFLDKLKTSRLYD